MNEGTTLQIGGMGANPIQAKTQIERFNDVLAQCADLSQKIQAETSSLNIRLYGEQPTEDGSSTCRPARNGATGMLEDRLDDLLMLLRNIDVEVARLTDLA